MNRTTKIKITELNPHVICVLCGGYFINATTIVECLHSFCRTCITRYLETSKYCPVCDVMVHKTRPLEYIRSDKTLQDLVYKLVPGLYKNEMKRRREYYASHDPPGVQHSPSEDRGDEFYDRIIYTEDEKMSLSLELCADGIPFKTPASINGHNGPENIKVKDVRYLHCPAAFSVGNLKKFIRMKFDLKLKYEIDIFHTAEPLHDYYTLMDIAYIYTWTRRAPLRLYYTVYERRILHRVADHISRCQMNTVHQEKVKRNKKDTEKAKSKSENVKKIEPTPIVSKANKPEKETSDNKSVVGKRKLLEGPDDISPDLDFDKSNKTSGHEHHRKDGSVPRKRAKKLTLVDSSVMEAMSESEEQLAKLTLDCSGDVTKASIASDSGSGSEKVPSSDRCDDSNGVIEDVNDRMQNNSHVINCMKSVPNENKSNKAETESKQVSSDSISFSKFQPLNASEVADNKSNSDKMYEFTCEQTSTDQVKPKGKSGRKKKVISDTGSSETISNATPVDINLVKSSKHPGLKSPGRPKKKDGDKQVKDTPSKDSDIKVKRTKNTTQNKAKKSKDNTDGDKGVKVKRKYVRKNVKTDDSTVKTPKKQSTSSNKKVSKTDINDSKDLPVNSDDQDVIKSGSQTDVNKEMNKNEVPKALDSSSNTECDNGGVQIPETATAVESTVNPNEQKNVSSVQVTNSVQEPVTPLYGQTPKVTELSQGLPTSPNPECAENGGLNGSANTVSVINNAANGNGANSAGFNGGVIGSISVSDVGAFGLHSNGLNTIVLQPSGPNSSGLHQGASFNTCVVSGASSTNGFNRNSMGVGLNCYSNILPGSVDCIMGGFPRQNLVPTGQMGSNGYPVLMDQGSDQPLDLTNNGHREEYTKGKIFKTKMLKKSYPKTDMPQVQKDKTSVPSQNGLNSQTWM